MLISKSRITVAAAAATASAVAAALPHNPTRLSAAGRKCMHPWLLLSTSAVGLRGTPLQQRRGSKQTGGRSDQYRVGFTKPKATTGEQMERPKPQLARGADFTITAASAAKTGAEGGWKGGPSDGERKEEESFFCDLSAAIQPNPARLHYGIAAVDVDDDGQMEFFVCGFGSANRVFKWDSSSSRLLDVASVRSAPAEASSAAAVADAASAAPLSALVDVARMAIGVAAADVDGDGREEIYVLNTDSFRGRKQFSDRLFDFDEGQGRWVDLLSLPQNLDDANFVAGRSVAAVDRIGSGRYGFFVASYGGDMKCFELLPGGFVADVARDSGLTPYPTGGRSLLTGPIVSHCATDIFAGNENGSNFLFVNKGDGSGEFVESAAAFNLRDEYSHARGVAFVDVDGRGELGICCSNWEGPHRLFQRSGPGPVGGAKGLGFADVDEQSGGFVDVAEEISGMATPSRIRSVIAADFDNDGFQELFFNNLGQPNRLFRQSSPGVWQQISCGEAELARGLGTGAAVADIDGDGRLELLISHGEAAAQPLALFRSTRGSSNSWVRVMPLTQQGAPARGALVRLRDSRGRWQVRVIDGGSGYLCCMEPVAHFGLGSIEEAVEVQIFWPDGSREDLKEVQIRRMHRVQHPKTRSKKE